MMGFKLQFVTLVGFHTLNTSMIEPARAYAEEGMAAYSHFPEREFELESELGYRAIKHQTFAGAGYFDEVQVTVISGLTSTPSLRGSTEETQFVTTPTGSGAAQ